LCNADLELRCACPPEDIQAFAVGRASLGVDEALSVLGEVDDTRPCGAATGVSWPMRSAMGRSVALTEIRLRAELPIVRAEVHADRKWSMCSSVSREQP
jgi:hypothetical protein